MPVWRLMASTAFALAAFAGNSLLCRIALRHGGTDAASFTLIRLLSGALCLALLVRRRGGAVQAQGSWVSALALFAYAAAFSWAYGSLGAGTGALLLFGAVQASMVVYSLWQGERLSGFQTVGWVAALAGLGGLLLPGWSAPPWRGSLLMLAAGLAWAVYTVRGRGLGDPLQVTAGNFARALVPALAGLALAWTGARLDASGLTCAVASGALASGLGYAVWYTVLPRLRVSTAATLQLGVPVIAAFGGWAWLGEPLSWRLMLASGVILGGIALVVLGPKRA